MITVNPKWNEQEKNLKINDTSKWENHGKRMQ